jgi:nitrogenase molybdenum-cofactor synthesis protein NifE
LGEENSDGYFLFNVELGELLPAHSPFHLKQNIMNEMLKGRKSQIVIKGQYDVAISCGKASIAGAVSQRACVFCGSRVVLYPIADALHLIHGPVGCSAYTWDIRGSLSSGPQLHRLSFTTDLKEREVVFGGETRLYNALISRVCHLYRWCYWR